MNSRLVLGAAVAASIVAGAWLALRPLPSGEEAGGVVATPRAPDVQPAAPRPQPPSAPTAAAPPRGFPGVKATPVRATLFNEYLQARQYREIYDRLRNSAEGETAEGRLVLWEILRNCAKVTEGRRHTFRPRTPPRDEFLAGIASTDPMRERRIAAYEQFTADHCQGLEGVAITQAALDKMLADSAAAGDPRARAIKIEQDLWTVRRAEGRDAAGISDDQIENLKEVLATRDPEAIRVAGRVLSNSWADYGLRFGPEQVPVEPRAFMNAWLVLACDYGQPCGIDTPRMLQACALRGHCDAMNYPDYLYYYGSTPHDSQLLMQYRHGLRQAIETGDWSQLTVVRGLPTDGRRPTFVPGPR